MVAIATLWEPEPGQLQAEAPAVCVRPTQLNAGLGLAQCPAPG